MGTIVEEWIEAERADAAEKAAKKTAKEVAEKTAKECAEKAEGDAREKARREVLKLRSLGLGEAQISNIVEFDESLVRKWLAAGN